MPEFGEGDKAVVYGARTSYDKAEEEGRTIKQDRDLIRYMMRNGHGSVFELVEFKFQVQMPIFVARQMIRHRIVSLNEVSARYSEMPDSFWIPEPEEVRNQSVTNKQGGEGVNSCADVFVNSLGEHCKKTYEMYKDFLEAGIAKEQARVCLPLNLHTRWVWKINLRSLFNFLNLRTDSHAQRETQFFANEILRLSEGHAPLCFEAWQDYSEYRDGMKLSRLEIEALQRLIAGDTNSEDLFENKREHTEWLEKRKRLEQS